MTQAKDADREVRSDSSRSAAGLVILAEGASEERRSLVTLRGRALR